MNQTPTVTSPDDTATVTAASKTLSGQPVAIREGRATQSDFCGKFAVIGETTWVTAILEAGRRSLDDGRVYRIVYDSNQCVRDVAPVQVP